MDGKIDSVSLVFATGFLGNPASYYGHLLLKLNKSGKVEEGRSLLDTSLNYGAIGIEGDDPITYIFKGIFGGYDGSFSHIQFYFHDHNYGEEENRDLWEYQLNLPREDLELLVAHGWELLDKRFTYYFFKQNCAYRMAELLSVVTPATTLPKTPLWTYPQSVLQKVAREDKLVAQRIYHPSRQSRFYSIYRGLNSHEKALFAELVAHPEKTKNLIAKANEPVQYAVLDALINYYQFIRKESGGDSGNANELYRKALLLRYQLPPAPLSKFEGTVTPPDAARSPSYVQISASSSNQSDKIAKEFWIRPSYYDELDGEAGHAPYSALTMAGIKLRYVEDEITVRSFDAIRIRNVANNATGYFGDRPDVWELRAGLESVNAVCDDCLVGVASGEWGRGYNWSSSVNSTFTFEGKLREDYQGSGTLISGAKVQLIAHLSESLSLRLNQTFRYALDNQYQEESVGEVTLRVRLGRQVDFRMGYVKSEGDYFQMGIGHYW
ncbi:hypothetical protein GCM10027567_31470 [Spongiibacter taiwanensis]